MSLILPDIENPFYTSLARGVEDVLQTEGLSLVLCNSDEETDKEQRYLAIAQSEKVAGIIIAPAIPDTDVSRQVAAGIAVVAVDRALNGPIDQVTFDNERVAEISTEDLIRRGYRRIACIAGPETASTANDRARGWRNVVEQAGLDCGDMFVRVTFRVDGGREATRAFLALEDPPDAILALDNVLGVGALQFLTGKQYTGIGLGVIGEIPFAASRTPNVTVTPLSPRNMGMTAARALIKRIGHIGSEVETIVQPIERPHTLRW